MLFLICSTITNRLFNINHVSAHVFIGVYSVHGHISQDPDITAWLCLVSFLGIIGVLSPNLLPKGFLDIPEKRSQFLANYKENDNFVGHK